MNIWIVNHYAIPPSLGGLVRHYYFSKYLQKKGHEVEIFTSAKIHNTDINLIKDNSLYKRKSMDGVKYTFIRSREYKGNGLDRILNMIDFPFQVIKTLNRYYKKRKPDVIYTSSPDLFVAFFAVCYGKFHRIPVVLEVRDLWPESIVSYNNMNKKNPIISILYQLEKWIYRSADNIIFTMQGGWKYIKEQRWDKKIDIQKVYHINNGVDIEEYGENMQKYKVHDSDLENPSVFKVIYVGSIRKVNHLHTLVEAAEVIKKKGVEDIRFIIYGDGTQREELEKECRKKQLNIVFKGAVDKKYIPYILSKADLNLINVMSSSVNRYGCSWNKLFEYMASKKPILSNTPVSYDLIKKNNLGISRKFSTAEEFAESILTFKDMDIESYNQMCQNAEQCAVQYDYKRLSDKLEKVLEKTVIMKEQKSERTKVERGSR
jgi:glycosyltransferase involved in cell wall biosynthesis